MTTTAASTTATPSNMTTTAASTTATPSNMTTTAASTTATQSNMTTTAASTTATQSNMTTTAASTTATQSNMTTTAASTTATPSNMTTTAASTTATLSNMTTTAASTTATQSNSPATPTTTALRTNTTTTVATTASQSNSPATPTTTGLRTNSPATPTTTALQSNSPATTTPSTIVPSLISSLSTLLPYVTESSQSSTQGVNPQTLLPARRKRAVPQKSNSLTQSSNDTSLIFQAMEVSCSIKTEINHTKCTIMLGLSHKIPSCCILQTLCAASKSSSDIHVVGKRIDEPNRLQNACDGNFEKPNSCIYSGPLGASCVESGPAYVIPPINLTNCVTENSCSCSSYCNRSDAYYTFSISVRDPTMNSSSLSSLMSNLTHPPDCSVTTNVTCQLLTTVASEYRSSSVDCEVTGMKLSCRVILGFAQEVSICSVAEAVLNLFLLEEKIQYDGQVRRAAICGSAEITANSLNFQFNYTDNEISPDDFCVEIEGSNLLTCQTGENVVVHLKEQCVVPTTASPNVTISPNVTSLNTTAISPNVTDLNTTASPNTTASQNATISTNSTIGPNVTVITNVTTVKPTAQPNNNTLTPTTTPKTQQNTTRAPSVSTTAAGGKPSSNTTRSTTSGFVSVTTSVSSTGNGTAESQAKDLLALAQDVSKLTAEQIDQLVSQLENLLSGPTVSRELGDVSVNIVSNLLDASPDTLSRSSDRIIGIVDTVGLKLVIGDTAESLLYPSLAVSVKPADGANFQEAIFSILDPNNVQVRGNPRLKRSAVKDSSIPQGSITLPPSLTQNLTAEEQKLVSRLQFNFYQKSSVFKDVSLEQRKLNSGILGASVANLSIKGLKESVVIRLRNTEPVPANFVAVCVFWDFEFNKGLGGWNSDGCFVKETNDNETVCACNHLTSFAILLDISRETVVSRVQATILTFITYIGCGLSAIFLSVTLLTYLAFGKLRKDIPSKILIQLCTALLLLNLVFLVDAWLALYPKAVGLCISTAWFLHYFLLVSFTWMGLEGVHMYYALVKVFNDNISHYMLKFSLVGWGVPMIVVIIVIAIDKNIYGLMSYGKFPDGTSDDFCWIKNDIAFYVAVVAYFGVIFIFNIIMFGVVLVQLHRIKKQNPHNNKHRSTAQDARSVIGITLLLGLTWGFAFFAWGPVNLAFMYLFAIFNSLQGFFIFVFHCAAKETVRRQWRTYLCCGSMRLPENSEWSRTATQKTAKSSQSSRPSRSTFLPSTPSGQMSGIGNPLEDRIITADEEPRTDVVLNEINSQLRSRRGS
ncbi:adhesion G-protein coupled receptor G2 [Poeciliopsis prolifica]|uniref:adhesion G-protein coupled receptor G2 n=1 Tax=Poeciliopsis prolifica TaxID=188132 RepID=UPI0024131EA5|nr:adhesion G-protein coupled receptor G2 [Poeciliopsis prolifica]